MTKKKPTIKSRVLQEKEQYSAFLQRFKTACDLMAGRGFFEQVPKHHLPQLFSQRLPPLKLEFAPGILTKVQETHWQRQFRLRLTDLSIKTLPDKTMPMADYFREGLLLANYASTMSKKSGSLPILQLIAGAYVVGSELFLKAAERIMIFVNSLCIIYSNFSGKVVLTDYTTTTILGAQVPDNKIKFLLGQSKALRLKIDGKVRDIFPLAWTTPKGQLATVKATPAKLGWALELTQKVPVYYQQHAATRLSERLSLPGGMLLHTLENHFYEQEDEFKLVDSQLLPLYISGKKLGYLVVDLLDDKLIIRTFLFLTNDGTPEGRKLAQITKLKKLDRQYLGIDTMTGFMSLAIANDPTLVELFTEAGCADLLDLAGLSPIMQTDVKVKNPDALLRYLENSPFMQRR
jgi:hypothetical protein